MDWWQEERTAYSEGHHCLCGIDEAGRGALAGPVVAGCVILPFECSIPDLNDSKKLKPAQREAIFALIQEQARGIGIGVVDAARIDAINILRAAHEAMRLALADLPPALQPDLALIDGLPVRPFPIAHVALVRGDGRSASIAAASIVAKVTRDRLMREYDPVYPAYGFARHKGYPAPSHLSTLTASGPCPLHRRTFRPVAECIAAQTSYPILIAHRTESPMAAANSNRKELGANGEIVVQAHLRRLGWEIVAVNFRSVHGEMDLIARETLPDSTTLVFVEVKTRRGGRHGRPIEAVDARKRSRLAAIAQAFLAQQAYGGEEPGCRFDIAEVFIGPDNLMTVQMHHAAFIID